MSTFSELLGKQNYCCPAACKRSNSLARHTSSLSQSPLIRAAFNLERNANERPSLVEWPGIFTFVLHSNNEAKSPLQNDECAPERPARSLMVAKTLL